MSLARDVTTVGTATLLSRLLGFLRDPGIAAVLGAGVLSDAYFAALQIPNFFRRLLAEGALNSAFVPAWLRLRDEGGLTSARRFGESILGTMAFVLSGVAILCAIFAPSVMHFLAPGFKIDGPRLALSIEFMRLAAPYIVISSFVAVAASILNAERRVLAASYGLVVFNAVLLTAVIVVVLIGAKATPLAGSILSIAIACAGCGQLAILGYALMRNEARPHKLTISFSGETQRFFMRAIPGMIASGIPQLKLIAGVMIASSSQAAVSWLYYANRLYELPLGLVAIAIATVMVPRIAASVRADDRDGIDLAQSRAFEIAIGLALPSAIAFALLAELIVGGLFQRGAFGPRDTAMVAAALTAISAGLPGHVLEKTLGAVSFAHEDTHTPMLAALCGFITAIVGSLALFPHYGHVGVAGAIALSGWVGATVLGFVLRRRGWLKIGIKTRQRLLRIALATIIMAIAIAGCREILFTLYDISGSATARIFTLIVLVIVGLGIYLGSIQRLGVAKFNDLLFSMRNR